MKVHYWKTINCLDQFVLFVFVFINVVEKYCMDLSQSTSGVLQAVKNGGGETTTFQNNEWLRPENLQFCCAVRAPGHRSRQNPPPNPTRQPAKQLFNTCVAHFAVHLPFPAGGFNLGVTGGVRTNHLVKQRLRLKVGLSPHLLYLHTCEISLNAESRRAGVGKAGFSPLIAGYGRNGTPQCQFPALLSGNAYSCPHCLQPLWFAGATRSQQRYICGRARHVCCRRAVAVHKRPTAARPAAAEVR